MSLHAKALPERSSRRLKHLLSVAWAQFRQHGYENTSVDGIARAAGTSKETIYRHFAGKVGLFRAALDDSAATLWESIPELAGDGDFEVETLERVIRTLHTWSQDPGRTDALWMSISVAESFPELAETLHQEGVKWLDPLVASLARIASGVPRATAREAAALLGALCIEGPKQVMTGEACAGSDLEDFVSRLSQLFLYGLPTPERPDPVRGKALRPEAPAPAGPASTEWPLHIRRLIDTSQAHFFSRGYENASLEEILREALVGRGTLYRYFGSKSGLFAAAAKTAAERLAERCAEPLPRSDDLRADLVEAAAACSRAFLDPSAIALYRAVISETTWNRELARDVYDLSRTPMQERVGEVLLHHQDAGRILIEDPLWWASQFMTLATAGNRYLSLAQPPDAAQRTRLARQAAEQFLHGLLPGSSLVGRDEGRGRVASPVADP